MRGKNLKIIENFISGVIPLDFMNEKSMKKINDKEIENDVKAIMMIMASKTKYEHTNM